MYVTQLLCALNVIVESNVMKVACQLSGLTLLRSPQVIAHKKDNGIMYFFISATLAILVFQAMIGFFVWRSLCKMSLKYCWQIYGMLTNTLMGIYCIVLSILCTKYNSWQPASCINLRLKFNKKTNKKLN